MLAVVRKLAAVALEHEVGLSGAAEALTWRHAPLCAARLVWVRAGVRIDEGGGEEGEGGGWRRRR